MTVATMRVDRWQRIGELFEQALQQPDGERSQWLAGACADDHALRQEVEQLLAADAGEGGPVDEFDAGDLLRRADPMLGQQVGAFRLVERIAAGGMGVVYRGERVDGLFTQDVAIKLIRAEMVSPELLRRFEAERRTLASLIHPNIARLYDGGTDHNGRPYFVLELVRGVPIDRYCRDAALTVQARLRLFVLVCRAVDHAHRGLVVHRDLKPSNILIDQSGQPKLLDFGIARVVEPQATGHDETLPGAFTPDYASPEQIAGCPPTTAIDVYSLGVVLYELLTGRRPFSAEGRPALEWQREVLERQPTRPSTVIEAGGAENGAVSRRRLRGDLDRILLMALRKEPERRYASALDFADDIERHLAGRPIRARDDTLAYRAGKFILRNRVPVAAAGAVLVAMIVALATSLRGRAEAQRQARHASEESESSRHVAEFLMDTFLTSSVADDPEQLAAAHERILFHAERVRRQYHDQPHQRANLLDALGQVALRLDIDESADHLLREGLSIR